MRPLPEKANRIFELIFYEAKFNEAESLFEDIVDPLEKVLARTFVINFLVWFSEDEKVFHHLEQFKIASKTLNDPFGKFYAELQYLGFSAFYYGGQNNPVVNLDQRVDLGRKALMLFNENEALIDSLDLWFQCLVKILANVYENFATVNKNKSLNLIYQQIEIINKMPIDGEQLIVYGGYEGIGYHKLKEGKFDEAYEAFNVQPKVPTSWTEYIRLSNLAKVENYRGNLTKAIEISQNNIELCKKNVFSWGIYRELTSLAGYFMEAGNTNKALQLHLDSLSYRKQHNNPIEQIIGYFELIRHLTIEYQINKDKDNLETARKYFQEMVEIKDQNENIITIKNYTLIAEAKIKKFGRLKDRAIAKTIFEKMVEFYYNETEFKLDLIEILLEDAQISDDKEIIQEINSRIQEIAEIGMFQKEASPSKYIQYQFLVARYQFYLKGNPDSIENTPRFPNSLGTIRFNSIRK